MSHVLRRLLLGLLLRLLLRLLLLVLVLGRLGHLSRAIAHRIAVGVGVLLLRHMVWLRTVLLRAMLRPVLGSCVLRVSLGVSLRRHLGMRVRLLVRRSLLHGRHRRSLLHLAGLLGLALLLLLIQRDERQ